MSSTTVSRPYTYYTNPPPLFRIANNPNHRKKEPYRGKKALSSSSAATSPSTSSTTGGGLPKSLSFRKICSKCGKTRGEHGELGFGHRCVYQDCGKCGAGVQTHIVHGIPMGILCTLTEKQGATPGAAAKYNRKIHDLAIRAELQQRLAASSSSQEEECKTLPTTRRSSGGAGEPSRAVVGA
jgi:hypothetical protein